MPKYFKAVEGRIVPRYGTATMIGANLARHPPKPGIPGPGKVIGWKQDLAKVVLIPDLEVRKFRREYINAVRRGDLLEATEAEHSAFLTGAPAPAPTRAPDAPTPDPTPTGPSEAPAADTAAPRGEEVVLDGPPKVESEPKTSKPAKRRRKKS